MLLNSDLIITPGLSSANQLNSVLHQNILEKVVIAGVGINTFSLHNQKPKDIDFLCIGRIKKFEGLDIIWQLIRQQKPKASFVVCGHATVNDIDRLRRLGIDHRGVVSEKEKIDLYSRAKVIAFPLIIEGFCMAVAEALYAQLYVVAWKIPVFDELYSHRCSQNIKLIEPKNYGDFAEQALLLTKALVKKLHQHDSTTHAKLATEWEQVGEKVLLSIRDLIDQPTDKLE